MPRRPTKAHVIAAYRRDALLRAAVRVFGTHGFDCATMERIAREADVAKGTTYLYYRSKQSIYDAALSQGLTELDERTRDAIERATGLREVISAFVTARAEYFSEHRDFFRMYVSAIARHVTSVKPRASEFQAMVDRQTRRLEQAISRAVARREIRRVDAAAAAVAVFDLTRGLVARGVVAPDEADVAGDAAFLSDLVWRGLGKDEDQGTREKGKRLRPERGAGGKRRPQRANASG
jgi:AcrR family transcriptional regulator